MKKSFLIIVLIISHFTIKSNAQDITFGIKGGVNNNNIGDFYSIGGSIGAGVPNEYFPADNDIGFQYGIYFNFKINYFFIRPEVNFVSFENSYTFPTKPAKWSAKQIDIPILFGYNIFGPISIYTGPIFSSISDMSLEGWQETGWPGTGPFTYIKSSTSISAGILIELGRFGIDFRYQYGLKAVKEQRLDMIRTYKGWGVNIGDLVEYNPSQFILSLQIDLFNFGGEKKHRKSDSNWRDHRNL